MKTKNAKRQAGYYWVKMDNEWFVGYYGQKAWIVFAQDIIAPDYAFDEINENRIISPEEQQKKNKGFVNTDISQIPNFA